MSYNITFTYYVPKDSSLSSTEIKAAVDKAVAEFVAWQCGKLGRDINPSVLIGKLMQTGIKARGADQPGLYHAAGWLRRHDAAGCVGRDHHGHEWGL